MATKPTWVTLSQTSGSGNGTFTIGATGVHTGRVARTGTVTVTGNGVSGTKEIAVTQAAKEEFADFDGTSTTIDKKGGIVTITGKSNSKQLTFEWVPVEGATNEYSGDDTDPKHQATVNKYNYPEINLPNKITINGDVPETATVTPDINGVIFKTSVIPTDDPGARAEYTYSFQIVAEENVAIEDIKRTLKVTCEGGQVSQITITQTAGVPTLSVSPTTIDLNNAGDAQTITVTSNTTWTIS